MGQTPVALGSKLPKFFSKALKITHIIDFIRKVIDGFIHNKILISSMSGSDQNEYFEVNPQPIT